MPAGEFSTRTSYKVSGRPATGFASRFVATRCTVWLKMKIVARKGQIFEMSSPMVCRGPLARQAMPVADGHEITFSLRPKPSPLVISTYNTLRSTACASVAFL